MIFKKMSSFTIYLATTIFITNITQIPQIINLGVNTIINLFFWMLGLMLVLMEKKISFKKKLINTILICITFFIFIIIAQIFTGNNYLSTSFVYPFLLAIFVFSIGFLFAPYMCQKDFNVLFYSYILSGVIVAIAVYLDSFSTGFSWSTISYAYSSKNSVSQIILTVIILLIFVKFPNSKKIFFIRITFMTFLIVLLFMLKSRASLLGLIVIICAVMVNKSIKIKHKVILVIFLIFFLIMVYINRDLYEIVINQILFANREITNLNSVSSGRFEMFKDFPRLFMQSPIIGRGLYYIESFPLSVLLQYGLIGSILILFFLIKPFNILLKMKRSNITTILLIILICYCINGLFEELSPLGPGVKCYMLWLLFGLIYGRKSLVFYNDEGKK